MVDEHDNHRRLHDAGVIDKDALAGNASEYAAVASFTSDEVDSLISIREKLGGRSLMDPETLIV